MEGGRAGGRRPKGVRNDVQFVNEFLLCFRENEKPRFRTLKSQVSRRSHRALTGTCKERHA